MMTSVMKRPVRREEMEGSYLHRAVEISKSFLKALETETSMEVVSIFRDAMNVRMAEEVFVLLSATVDRTPIGAVLEEPLDFRTLLLLPGERVTLQRGVWRSQHCTFDFREAIAFDSQLPSIQHPGRFLAGIRPMKKVLMEEMASVLDGGTISGGFQDMVLKYRGFEELLLNVEDFRRSHLKRHFHLLLNEYIATFRTDALGTLDVLKKFIGLGHGLTPSGDDFLLGMLSMLQFAGCAREPWKDFLEGMEAMLEASRHRTTPVSDAYLKAAVKRSYSAPVLAFYAALEHGGEDAKRRAIRDLAALGQSSGMDTLSGMLLAMKTLQYGMRSPSGKGPAS